MLVGWKSVFEVGFRDRWYDPLKKETNLKAPEIKKWLANGAQPSDTVKVSGVQTSSVGGRLGGTRNEVCIVAPLLSGGVRSKPPPQPHL